MAYFNVNIKPLGSTAYSRRQMVVNKFSDGRAVTTKADAIKAVSETLVKMGEDPAKLEFTARLWDMF